MWSSSFGIGKECVKFRDRKRRSWYEWGFIVVRAGVDRLRFGRVGFYFRLGVVMK